MTEQPRSGTNPWIIVILTLIGAAIVGALILGAFLVGRTVDTVETLIPEEPIERIGSVTVEQIQQLAELTTVRTVAATTVQKGTDRGWLNWAAGDQVSMLAVAEIGAGIDLGELDDGDISADPDARTVRMTLPAPAITYVAVDNEASHVYDRDTGIFIQGDPDLERAARLAAEEILVEEAIEAGLLNEAERSARLVLTDFLRALGYETIEIDFR